MTPMPDINEPTEATSALLPCPFCGSRPVLNHGATDDWDISCRNSNCFGPATAPYGLRSDAIAAWNRRVTSSEPPISNTTDPLRSGAAEGNEADAAAPKPYPGRFVAEPSVPDHVIEAFERKYGGSFDLSRDDHEWRNTWRYKHHGIQMCWEGWRDGYLALSDTSSYEAPTPNPAIAELVERLILAHDAFAALDGVSNDPLVAVLDAIAALTASNDRVAELERERDEAREYGKQARLRENAAEAEVSRLKAGAVTGWQSIESVPKDGRSIAVWLPATATEQPHAFAPVSICEDGTWWDDSTGDQIEPLAATYWAPIHAPSALSNQAGASK